MTIESQSMEEAASLKEEGNKHFKNEEFSEALACYTKAINLNASSDSDTATYLKNRAACYLKQRKYQEATLDCSASLELVPSDPKTLFRRCQAYEEMLKYEDAYKDAMSVLKVDPKNKAIQPVLTRLNPIIQAKMNQQMSTDNQVEQMFDLTFNMETEVDEEKRHQAATNLIVLARESAGAEKIVNSGGIQKLVFLLDTEKDKTLQATAIRILACLCANSDQRARQVQDTVSLRKICAFIGTNDEQLSTAMTHVLQCIINAVTDLENFKAERDKYEAERKADVGSKKRPYAFLCTKMTPEAIAAVDVIMLALIPMLNFTKVSAFGRDNVMELMIKFISSKDGVGWHNKIIEAGGIGNMLEAAGTIPENNLIPISQNTRMHVSLLLTKIYESMNGDKERQQFNDAVDIFFNDLLMDKITDSKVEAVLALAALLQGPSEVGNTILGRTGMLELILALADSGNAIYTKYAVEALVHSTSKKQKCAGVIKQATPILKELYQSQSDTIKVRALVGLCKLGSYGGQDSSSKSFAEGSTQTLAKACRKYLANQAKDIDLRKWAAEGLAYLTLDADVKEDLVTDTDAFKSLVDLTKTPDKGTVYPVAQVFVNITNTFDQPEADPEMVELAKFAKHHVPEPHEKDGPAFVEERMKKVVKMGIINALVALSKTESHNSRELLARVFLGTVMDPAHRGLVIQQGGAKALIPLAIDSTDKGKMKAAQALAKLAITSNPEIAFPGERACEVVRPLIHLLNIEEKALENYEALLALTNLASHSDTVRKRIVKEKGMNMIEYYMFEEHPDLRRASIECVCNLVMNEEVAQMFKGENDRLKYLLLLCGEEDQEDLALIRATAGTICILTSEADREICNKLVHCTERWVEILQMLTANEMPDIQYRGVYILRNIMVADKEIAARIVETTLLEILMALSKVEDPDRQAVKECADKALQCAVDYELIKPFKS